MAVSGNTRDVLDYQYADTGSYPVKLIVLDTSTNCLDTVIKLPSKDIPDFLYVPNAFYPNSIQNPVPFFSNRSARALRVWTADVDSWGKLLFHLHLDAGGSPVDGWDGMFNGKPMPPGCLCLEDQGQIRNGQMWAAWCTTKRKGAPGPYIRNSNLIQIDKSHESDTKIWSLTRYCWSGPHNQGAGPLFTQFQYTSSLNPGLIGCRKNNLRLSRSYQDQWFNLYKPYSDFPAAPSVYLRR